MMLGLFFSILFESGLESATRFSFRYLIDEAVIPRNINNLVLILSLLACGTVVLTFLCVLGDYLWARLGTLVINDMRRHLFTHIQALSMDFFSRRNSGDVLNCFLSDAASIENCLVTVIPYAVVGVSTIAFSLTFMISMHPLLSIGAFAGLVLCFVLPRLFIRRAGESAFQMHQQEGALAATIQENLQSQPVIKVFGLERRMLGLFSGEVRKLIDISVRANFLSYLVQRIPVLTFVLMSLAVFGGSAVLSYNGKLSMGELISFQVLTLGLSSSIANLTWLAPILVNSSASLRRLNDIFKEVPSIREADKPVVLPPLSDSVAFDKITFTYPGHENAGPALSDISFSVPRGDFAVFVGPSGSGKSSILHLLLRLYDPDEGQVLFDGIDVKCADVASLRSGIGLVSQDVLLFNTSVLENIRMGKLDAGVDEVKRALREAEVLDFVEGLPQGLGTVLGERGGKLSGGQRQRMALARALIRRPSLLVLDEATSSLDPAVESDIFATIRKIARERGITVIAVTHTMKLASLADKVFVIRDGRIEAAGSHRELLEQEGLYARLWEMGHA